MLTQNLLLKCLYRLITVHFLHTTSFAKQNPYNCSPSACGHIRNISYPFRLRDDPKHCGDENNTATTLYCENNTTTTLYLDSHKFLVQAINYDDYTIRLTDPSIKNHSCSFPQHSLSQYNIEDPYYSVVFKITRSVTFMSCPNPVSNSAIFLETTEDCFNQSSRNHTRHTYIKLGNLDASDVPIMCRIDLVAMTSMPFKDENNVTLSEIHSSLLYGIQLSFRPLHCRIYCRCAWYNGLQYCSCYTNGSCQKQVVLFVEVLNWILGILSLVGGYGVAVYLALRIVIGMPCMLGLLIYKLRQRRHSSMFDVIEGFLQSNHNLIPIRYSYTDIKKMTRGFREQLGKGGYGSVYKGKLRSGHDVAVKVLSKPKADGQDFINEVATIGRIHHVNVVKLVGYCAERSKRALVYDYMTNGSLEKYIFNRERANSLSWERKYEIAIGVARGIEYLHQGCNIQILHFDIKPHNILLDDNFTPKISDFGLAKFYSTENTTVTLTAARGTIGYVAPELINRSIGGVSYKADVYSFGMLLMEMVGLKDMVAADDDESSKYFPYWIYDHLNKGKDIEIGNVDADGDDDEYARKITRKMAIVGLWCIQMSPNDRPSMGEVLRMFEDDGENLEIPPEPSQLLQTTQNNAETWGIEPTDSIALLGDDASIDD